MVSVWSGSQKKANWSCGTRAGAARQCNAPQDASENIAGRDLAFILIYFSATCQSCHCPGLCPIEKHTVPKFPVPRDWPLAYFLDEPRSLLCAANFRLANDCAMPLLKFLRKLFRVLLSHRVLLKYPKSIPGHTLCSMSLKAWVKMDHRSLGIGPSFILWFQS